MSPQRLDAMPPPERCAYFLDLDGTLIDIAPAPDLVVVPPGLTDALHGLRRRCGDAMAVVTGRPIAQVEQLLGDAPFAIAGEHGAAIRRGPGAPVAMLRLPAVPPAWVQAAKALAAANPGAAYEPKAHGFVLHYRGAPACGETLRTAIEAMLRDGVGDFVVLAAKMAWEIRPRGVDKGAAVRALMREPPFGGRSPVFIGDDVTDEDGIEAAVAVGGHGLRVGTDFIDAGAVRAWLAELAQGFKPRP